MDDQPIPFMSDGAAPLEMAKLFLTPPLTAVYLRLAVLLPSHLILVNSSALSSLNTRDMGISKDEARLSQVDK